MIIFANCWKLISFSFHNKKDRFFKNLNLKERSKMWIFTRKKFKTGNSAKFSPNSPNGLRIQIKAWMNGIFDLYFVDHGKKLMGYQFFSYFLKFIPADDSFFPTKEFNPGNSTKPFWVNESLSVFIVCFHFFVHFEFLRAF